MFARKTAFLSIGRAAMLATVAALTLTAVEPSPALAGPMPSGIGAAAATAPLQATDVRYRGRVYRGGGGAAAAAGAFAAIVGTGVAIAASQNRDDYYYGGGPAYYGGGPGYYGGGPVYYGGYGGYRDSGVPRVNGHPLADW
jgi:hypothetical protein